MEGQGPIRKRDRILLVLRKLGVLRVRTLSRPETASHEDQQDADLLEHGGNQKALESKDVILDPSSLSSTTCSPSPIAPSASDIWKSAAEGLSAHQRRALGFDGEFQKLPDEVLGLVATKQRLCTDKQWTFEVNGKAVVLREVAGKLIGWVDRFKVVGDLATQFDPVHAALPWAGLRFLLQVRVTYDSLTKLRKIHEITRNVVVDDAETMGAILVYTESITHCMARCSIYEGLYFSRETRTCIPDAAALLGGSVKTLYTKILVFLSEACLVFCKNIALRMATSIFTLPKFSLLMREIESYASVVWQDANTAESACMIHLHLIKSYARGLTPIQDARATQETLQADSNKDRTKLKSIFEELEQPMRGIEEKITIIGDHLDKTVRSRILMWLSTQQYRDHHETISSQRLELTGTWLLNHRTFSEWKQSSKSSILWLHGKPGSGKTFLVSLVIDTFLKESEDNQVAYFYCKRNNNEPDRQKPEIILSTIVKQLASTASEQALEEAVVDEYTKREKDGFAKGYLKVGDSLRLIHELSKAAPQTTIILDALDECDPATRHGLVKGLHKLICDAPKQVKIFVSSRDDDDIAYHLEKTANLRIDARNNRSDIDQFVVFELRKCIQDGKLLRGRMDADLVDQVTETLQNKADGMFLWVDFQIRHLCMMNHKSEINANLGKLPKGLEDMYSVICDDILAEPGSGLDIAKAALKWIFCAFRIRSPNEVTRFVAHTVFGPESAVLDFDTILKVTHNLLSQPSILA